MKQPLKIQKSPKLLSKPIRKWYSKTLGTSVINSSLPNKSTMIIYIFRSRREIQNDVEQGIEKKDLNIEENTIEQEERGIKEAAIEEIKQEGYDTIQG